MKKVINVSRVAVLVVFSASVVSGFTNIYANSTGRLGGIGSSIRSGFNRVANLVTGRHRSDSYSPNNPDPRTAASVAYFRRGVPGDNSIILNSVVINDGEDESTWYSSSFAASFGVVKSSMRDLYKAPSENSVRFADGVKAGEGIDIISDPPTTPIKGILKKHYSESKGTKRVSFGTETTFGKSSESDISLSSSSGSMKIKWSDGGIQETEL